MNTVLLALVVAAVFGGLLGYSMRRSGTDAGQAIEDKDSFLRAARAALATGRRVVRDLDAIPDRIALEQLESDELRLLIGRVDVFGSQMTQVTCLAPTSMDARVSRSVAVSATAVGDTLRDERDRRLDDDDDQISSTFADRCAVLAVAVTDLGNHVELL